MYTATAFVSVFALVICASRLMDARRLPPVMLGTRAGKTNSPVRSFQSILFRLERMVPRAEKDSSLLRTRLAQAGFRKPEHLEAFHAAQVLLPAALCALTLASGVFRFNPVLTLVSSLALGYIAPAYVLRALISRRHANIRFGLPDALDLLVVCLDPGMGLDQAIARVGTELQLCHPEIGDEFNRIALEQRAGRPRAEAWRNFAGRTGTESVRDLVTTLVQADQFGSSLGKALRTQSDALRTRRRLEVEEKGAKTTVKLLFPLAFCIFPAMLVVMIGPAFLRLAAAFGGLSLE